MEGAMFYWICWIYWIYLTFLLDRKNPYRLKLAIIVLAVIILSDSQFTVDTYEISVSGLFLLFLSYFFISKEKRRAIIYMFICSLIVSISYVTFLLFEIFDPVWMIFKKEWMIGICFLYLAVLLQKTLKGRLLIIVSGTMQGEILYAFFLSNYHFSYPIGSFAYLDVCLFISALLAGWSCIENAGVFFENPMTLLEKGKQKLS